MDFRSSRARRAFLSPLLGGVAALALTASWSDRVAAQSYYDGETLVIGGGAAQRGSVSVDMGALDAMDGSYTAPAPARTGAPSRPGGRIILTPPGGQSGVPRAAAPVPQRTAPAATASRPARTPAPSQATAAPAPTRPVTPPPAPMAAPMPEPTPAPAPAAAAPAPTPAPAPAPAAVASAPPPRAAAPAPAPAPQAAARPTPAPTPTPAPAPTRSAAPEIRTPGFDMEPPAPTQNQATAGAPTPAPAPASAPVPAPSSVAAVEPRPAPVTNPPPRTETPAAPPPRQQTAAVAPVPQPPISAGETQALRISFSGENTVLPEPSKSELKGVVDTMTKNPAMRVQVKAYASGNAEAASKARRTSLSRALAVRANLIEQGIGSTRIDVRALGNNAEGGPGDRVDLVLVAR